MKVGAKVSNDEVIMELGIDELTNADVYFKKITDCLEVCYLKNRVDKPLGFYWHSFATDFELAFKEAKKCGKVAVVHIKTKKGKGYEPAEN